MKYPKCPSCGNELLDKTDQCPFCGTDLPRLSLQLTGVSMNHQTKIIILIGAMMLISGAGFTYYLMIRSEKTAELREKISEQVILHDTNTQQCFENMYRILDAEDEFMEQNGRYADNIDELNQFDSTLDLVCPESGLPYSIVNTKQSVQVICSVHGEI